MEDIVYATVHPGENMKWHRVRENLGIADSACMFEAIA